MTDHTTAAQAAGINPLSDEYVNAVIQQHGYQSPETVIARLSQWIGLHGGENGVTLLMYEAHKALVKLRAPVADERAAFERRFHIEPENWSAAGGGGYRNVWYEARWEGWKARAAMARAPVADEGVRTEALYLLREARALLPLFTTAEAIGDWSEKVERFAAGHAIDIPASAPVAGEAQPVADAAIKAAYVEHFGHAAGWLSYKGSWFIEGYRAGRNAAPQASTVAGEAQKPVAWMLIGRLKNSEPKFTLSDPAGIYESVYAPLYAAPQASAEYERGHADGWAAGWDQAIKQPQADKDGAEQALKDLVTHGVSVQRIAPADFMADRQPRAGDGKTREAVDYPRGGALNFDDPAPASAEGIRSPYNACMHRNECRAMLDRQERAGEVPSDDALAQIGYAAAIAEVGWGEAWADLESDGDTQQEWRAGAKAIRAALSAPQAEQGERDA